MKKITSLFLVLAVVFGFMLTGCGSSGQSSQSNKKVKVGFIYIGTVNDGGWTEAHDAGRKYLVNKLHVDTIYKESVKEDSAEVQKVTEDMINQGCNVIIGTSFGFGDGMAIEAKKHPDVKFMHCSGYKTSTNMSTYFGRDYQARYLSGIVAGMKTKANKIGYVGAFETPEVVRGIDGFTLGVRSVNPNAIVKVNWTHTWYDPAKEKEAAKALIDQGVDVIAQHQDSPAAQEAAEEAKISSIGYDSDMSSKAPNAYMTAPIWNWGTYYVKEIKAIQDGTWKSEKYFGSINDGIITLAPLTKNAPAGAQAAVDKAKADIASGKNKIMVGPLKDQTGAVKVPAGKVMTDDELLNINWFVQGVEGQLKK